MTNLPALLGTVTAILQAHPICLDVKIVETREFSPDQFLFKVRSGLLPQGYDIQLRIYYNHGHIDYAYQLFSDAPLLRWDNKEEFRHLETYPHHYHDNKGSVTASPLVGDPQKDIQQVLQEVERFIANS